jgi:glyoxylase-like metal-dependent hydrolase (beta-lactamase superfamily II)
MHLRQLFDRETSTYTYLVADPQTRSAALIDPVREHIERDLKLIEELDLTLEYVLDTHVHADHVTASGALRDRTGARSIGSTTGAKCADLQVRHGDRVTLGDLEICVLETPGHTDDSLSFLIDGNVFTGDALLIRGTGRTDFQNGSSETLWDSLTKVLFQLPDDTVVWPGHDYQGHTRSSIGEEKHHNPRVAGKTKAEFIRILDELELPPPKHIDEAVPANRECGQPGHA